MRRELDKAWGVPVNEPATVDEFDIETWGVSEEAQRANMEAQQQVQGM